jgi:hypothetical protein
MLVAVVGPCASGKTSLVRALLLRGYRAREVAQEHSVVPDLWRRTSDPDLLIYLDVSPSSACQRQNLASPASWWPKAAHRLALARQSADLYILTDELSPQEVLVRCLTFLGAVAADALDSSA